MDSLRLSTPLEPADVLAVLPGLFWDNDCVMLPGLGGFVCNPRSARYDESKRELIPPSRDVLFNPRLTTNDGLVANALMQRFGVGYPEALAAVEGLVAHVLRELERGETVALPGLGRLYREDDAQLRFMPDVEFERMLRSFGHASIPLMPLASSVAVTPSAAASAPALSAAAPVPEATAVKEPSAVPSPAEVGDQDKGAQPAAVPDAPSAPRGDVVPFRVRLGRVAAVVAIPLTLAGAWLLAEPTGGETLLGSNPLWSSRPTAAQFAPRTVAPSLAVAPVEDVETASEFVRRTAWEGALTFDVVRGVPAENGMRLDVPRTPVAAPADPELEAAVAPAVESVPAALEAAPEAVPVPDPTPAPTPAALEAAQEVRFMIVGGAFAVEENAQKLAQLLSREGFDTSLHFQAHNQLTVVSLGGYATEAEARKALDRARRQGQDKAWLKRL